LRAGGPRFKSGRPDHIYGTVKVFEQPAGLPSGIHRVSLGSEVGSPLRGDDAWVEGFSRSVPAVDAVSVTVSREQRHSPPP
jgi:hypothetical protein